MRKKHAPAIASPIPRPLAPATRALGAIPSAASIARALATIGCTLGVGVVACSKHEAPTRDTPTTNSASASASVASASVSASASLDLSNAVDSNSPLASAVASSSASVVAAASCSASVHVHPHVGPGGIGLLGTGTKFPNVAGGNAPVNPMNTTTAAQPQVMEAGLSIQGSEPPDAVKKTVRARLPAIRACYQKGLAMDPALHGVVSTTFHIQADGKVKSASESSSLGNAQVEQCIQRVFASTTFPESDGDTTVVYPLAFTTAGDA